MRVVAATPAVIAHFLKLARPDLMKKADPYQQSAALPGQGSHLTDLTERFSQEVIDFMCTSRCQE